MKWGILIVLLMGHFTTSIRTPTSNQPIDKTTIEFHVVKSEQQCMIWDKKRQKILDTTYCVFGWNAGPKQKEGDKKTPEGRYRILSINKHHPKFGIFMAINYPNKKDRARCKKNKIKHCGSQIGIHGAKGNKELLTKMRINWTLGCIALTNEDMETLLKYYLEVGTWVEIRP